MSNQKKTRAFSEMRQAGVTLVEMMAVVAIGAILVGVGLPSFKGLMARQGLSSFSSGLLSDLVLAREEAKNSTVATTLCASSNGTACTASAWRLGYIVFRDSGTPGVVDPGDVLLRMAPAAKDGVTSKLAVQSTGAAYSATFVRFDDEGKLGNDAALQFTTCYVGESPQLVVVRRNGHITPSKGTSPCA